MNPHGSARTSTGTPRKHGPPAGAALSRSACFPPTAPGHGIGHPERGPELWQEVDGQHHFRVLDAHGTPIGTIRKVPPKSRPFKHTWRIDQPDRPEIAGRNEWSGVDARSLALRVTGEAMFSVLSAPLSGEGDDSGRRSPRVLVWKGGSEIVMASGGDRPYRVLSDWLDRRLAFAVALLGDQFPTSRNHHDTEHLWAPRPA
ncbi:hypothetical protein ACFV98_05305 [Streptomyces violascens]|uniref:hypothetical protein n=1 Tax=Streptomyces violascens TaxID=67381 RepID=UPI00365289A8